jgi:hypothetical protein
MRWFLIYLVLACLVLGGCFYWYSYYTREMPATAASLLQYGIDSAFNVCK